MALPSFLKRKEPRPTTAPPDPLAEDTGPVQQARTQARRRLIGAVVLLAIGVVVFPMLFETQPRPLAGDVPIELPRRDGPPARAAVAPPRHAAAMTEPVPEPTAAPVAASGPPLATASSPLMPVPAAEAASATPAPQPDAPRVGESPARRSEKAAVQTPAASADARSGRFVVQVGAYTDAGTLREVRAKVERLGLKTYTQSIETDAGRRTRVRVGPFATRAEAESASGKLKGAGLPGNILVL